ncbi:hypothetical protein BU15DRAFT_60721 [Melanogaster broomeanus]|nr:hypothetical protein BU15DRAFT_60721 [Melanogaster broomeanus]
MPPRRKSEFHGDNKEHAEKDIKNVVVFGESGVGKSSLINLIAGVKVSPTSSGAVGCTLEYKRHLLTLGEQSFAVWDTAGLDEGTCGTVPAEQAEVYLKQLLRDLTKASGIDLLVYCARGTRVRSGLLSNYQIFYSAICRRKVPIAIVVTGLENQENCMDSWWQQNEKDFSALAMHFDNYACVTTLESSTPGTIQSKRLAESKDAVTKLITTTCRTNQWKPDERSWIETAFSDIRAILSPKNDVRPANVIMCDASRQLPISPVGARSRSISFHNPVGLSLSLSRPVIFRNPISIVSEKSKRILPFENAERSILERSFRVYQVPQKPTESSDEEPKQVVKRGADLLIFCVEAESQDAGSQWEHFYLTYGGDLSPQIVVVIGASDQSSAAYWWTDVAGKTDARDGAKVTFWPTSQEGTDVEAAKTRLQELITTCCLDCNKASIKNEHVFRHSLRIDTTSTKPQSSSRQEPAEPDILTKWGVWQESSSAGDQPLSPTTQDKV